MKPDTNDVSRRKILSMFVVASGAPLGTLIPAFRAFAAPLPPVEVWKDASCGCCLGWVEHMRQAGFTVTINATEDMDSVKRTKGVPDTLQSCHTAVVNGYVLEGHVPAADALKLLAERPAAKGLAVPGMPASAPGMDQPGEAYEVILFGTPTGTRTYARYSG
jgi:hypothetical protein